VSTWIAINLRDFHRPDKKWQRGEQTHVEVKILRANTMERAKETAQWGNNDPWQLFRMQGTKNIIYAKVDAEKIEQKLRDSWNARGVPKERQDEVLRNVEEKAKPGAMVGPFKIPE